MFIKSNSVIIVKNLSCDTWSLDQVSIFIDAVCEISNGPHSGDHNKPITDNVVTYPTIGSVTRLHPEILLPKSAVVSSESFPMNLRHDIHENWISQEKSFTVFPWLL